MFSEREEKIIKILGNKRLPISMISHQLFKDDKNKPFDAKITVANSINRIVDKCAHYKLPWILYKERCDKKLIIFKGKS